MGPYPNCHCRQANGNNIGFAGNGGGGAVGASLFETPAKAAAAFQEANRACANHALAREVAHEIGARLAQGIQRTSDRARLARFATLKAAADLVVRARRVLQFGAVARFYNRGHFFLGFLSDQLEAETDAVQVALEEGATLGGSVNETLDERTAALRARLEAFLEAAGKR